jgi:GR25 family glycosyltransferase involved in LPS biosynthesis
MKNNEETMNTESTSTLVKESASKPHSIWSRFPLILCINLKEREDRLAEVRQEFSKVELEDVTFFRTTRQKSRNKGCIDSHMACLQYAVERQVPYVLVFEDDVLFLENHRPKMEKVIGFLEKTPDWKIFHLGGFIYRKKEYPTPEILRGGILCTQAYIIKTEFAKEILAKRSFYTLPLFSVDLFFAMLVWNSGHVYFKPLICIQRASASDGTWSSGTRDKEGWLGQAMIYTAMNYKERRQTKLFPTAEKLKIENGLSFFLFYRVFLWILQRVVRVFKKTKLEPPPPGEFIPMRQLLPKK